METGQNAEDGEDEMNIEKKKLLDASCRMALAAILHDIGKFAERARISEAEVKDNEGNSRRDVNVQLYCPHFGGCPTHIHAAHTAIALDMLERHMPEIVGGEMTPFAPWRNKDAGDSLINAAARHHRPESFLQWIIATADRVASGFEREEFENYNSCEDKPETGKNHCTTRQLTLFEQIRPFGGPIPQTPVWRYRLLPLAPEPIFPVKAEGYEKDDTDAAQGEYNNPMASKVGWSRATCRIG